MEINVADLERSLRRPRALFSFGMSLFTTLATLAALFPLVSVLFLLVKRGSTAMGLGALRDLPPAAMARAVGSATRSSAPW